MIKLGEMIMILDLHRQGLSVSAIARESGFDRKTVRRTIARSLEPPRYGPRKPRPRLLDPFMAYLRERVTAWPGLTGTRLLRELRELGYAGGYSAVTDYLREVRPTVDRGYEVRFETPPGLQGQVDFAQFPVVFTDESDRPRVVWLFSLVLGHSRAVTATPGFRLLRLGPHPADPASGRCPRIGLGEPAPLVRRSLRCQLAREDIADRTIKRHDLRLTPTATRFAGRRSQ